MKNFEGGPSEQMKLLKQADKLQFLIKTPLDTVIKQSELVSDYSSPIKSNFNSLVV